MGRSVGPEWDRGAALRLYHNPMLPKGVKEGKQVPRYSFFYSRNMFIKSFAFFKLFLLTCTWSLMNQVATCNFSLCMAIPACRAEVFLHVAAWTTQLPEQQPVLCSELQGCQLLASMSAGPRGFALVLGSWEPAGS